MKKSAANQPKFRVALIVEGSVEVSYFDKDCLHTTQERAHVWTWKEFLNDLEQCMPNKELPVVELRFEYVK